MILFIAGIVTGSVLTLVAYSIMVIGKHADNENEPAQTVTDRLNKEKKEREKKERDDRNAELERQFEMMMNYHGKEQKKA